MKSSKDINRNFFVLFCLMHLLIIQEQILYYILHLIIYSWYQMTILATIFWLPEARTTNMSRNSWNSTNPLLFLSTIMNMLRTNMELGFNPRASANSVLVSFILIILFKSSPLMFSIWSCPGCLLNACNQY